MLLRTAVFLGIAAAASSGLLDAGGGGSPAAPPGSPPGGGPAAGGGAPPAGGPGAAGAPGAQPEGLPDASHRLQPMTAEAPAKPPAVKPAVRTRPILELPQGPAAGDRAMLLTFDDGPDPRYTPAILDTLRRYGVRAMFFVCGEMATDNRDLLRRMAAEGHVIGNHTWTHPQIPQLSRSALEWEIGRTSEVVEQAVGQPPLWFRAPYGAWNRAAFEIGADLGMEPLAWTVDSLDWTEPGTTTIVSRILDGAAPGVIVLNHDAGGNRSQSVRALEAYLPQLLARGYRMTLPVLPPR